MPVLIFYTSAVAWLILGTLLAGFVSFKLHTPDLLSDISFLTWGRVRPVHMNVMVYGWASMAGMGTAIWLMARLCRTVLRYPLLLVAGAGFWNLGVFLGVCGILLGDSTGYQWLEFPSYAAIILFVAYTLVASWAVLMFRFRRGEQIYITQWYLLAAFLWFPWLYAAGQLMLFVVPVQGVLQAAVGWWYANNLLFLWFGAIGLGTAYYMIPKVIGRPVMRLSFGNDRFLELRVVLQLDRDAAPRRWTVPSLDGHCKYRGHNPHADSRRDRWAQSSHDDARAISR